MKELISENINNIKELENLYRQNPDEFSIAFNELFPTAPEEPVARFWFTRLNYKPDTVSVINEITQPAVKTGNFDLWFTIIAALIAGTYAKLPMYFGFSDDIFHFSNLPFYIIPLFAIYYIIKRKVEVKSASILLLVIVISLIFNNLLPGDSKNHTHILTSIHLTILMLVIGGISFVGFDFRSTDKIITFYKRIGDLAILTAVILCGGIILTSLTFGLFSMIKIRIERFYYDYIIIYGLTAAPFVANYMIENTPTIINKVAPFIAKIFTPLVLVLMTCFLIALIFFSNDPFNNRDELITYNILLIVNLAIIVFAFTGQKPDVKSFYNKLFIALSIEAIIINSIALSAIIYRLAAFGISPNRLAVLGGNVLMFINLLIIAYKLFKYVMNRAETNELNRSFTFMLPYYTVWVIFVAFIFPFIFWFQ